jgi:prophage antirepressor-like protein
MLNIFRKKEEISKQNETNLLVKQFNGLNIQVYGTYENPLFKAKEIGELLDIKNIKDTIKNYNSKQKLGVVLTDPHGRPQETNMLTEQGLYKILMKSRKPIAEQFQDWVCEVIEEIRKRGKYDLEEQLRLKDLETQRLLNEKEKQLEEKDLELIKYKEKTYEEIEKTGHIYVIKTDGGTKVGKTKDAVNKRIRGLQTGNVNNIEILLDFKTSNPDLLEKCAHYILDRYRCNSNREFFDCDINYIKTIVEICGNVINTLKSTYQHISKDELVQKLKNNGVEIGIEEVNANECDLDDQEMNDLYSWLKENIKEKRDSILKLKDVCELYSGKAKIPPKLSNKLRMEIEKFIGSKYKHLNEKYKDSSFNGERYRGWVDLQISKNKQ